MFFGSSARSAQFDRSRSFSGPAIKLIRYEEEWSAECDARLRTDYLDRVKCISLSSAPAHYLSLGGEFRGVSERIHNDNWIYTPYPTNSFGLERFQLHADFHFNPKSIPATREWAGAGTTRRTAPP